MTTVLSLDDVLRTVRPKFRFPFTISSTNRWVAFTAEGQSTKAANLGVSDEAEGASQWVSDLETGQSFPLVPKATSSWAGTWSPNGKMLAFYSDKEGNFLNTHKYTDTHCSFLR